jgi:hypothetical protein
MTRPARALPLIALGAVLATPTLAVMPAPRPADSGDEVVAPAPTRPSGPLLLIMRGLDKITGRPTTLVAPIGKPIQYATLTITARYCYSTPQSETPETAAFVQIDDHRPDKPERRVFSGWMYASSPGLNGMEHPIYDVWVITCKANTPGQAVAVGPLKPVKPASPDASDNEKPTALPEDAGQ